MGKKQPPNYDANVQLKVWCLVNKHMWYLSRFDKKMDPRFSRVRLFTQRAAVSKALKIYRERFNDDSLYILPLMVTQSV